MSDIAKTLAKRTAFVRRYADRLGLGGWEITVRDADALQMKDLTDGPDSMAFAQTFFTRNHAIITFLRGVEDRLGDEYCAAHECVHVVLDPLYRAIRDVVEVYVRDESAKRLLTDRLVDEWETVTDKIARGLLKAKTGV